MLGRRNKVHNKVYVAILFMTLFLISCSSSGPICNTPYIVVGDSCCLDNDANAVCDRDETIATCEEQELDCSTCPPRIITETETVEVVKILCADGQTLSESIQGCKDLLEPEPEFTPITTNEDNELLIETFTARTACRGGFQAVEIYFKLGGAPTNFKFQVKDETDGLYKTIADFNNNIVEEYMYGAFCNGKCTENADFFLEPGKKYLFRATFDYTNTSWKRNVFSNEHILDHTDDGEYATKLC